MVHSTNDLEYAEEMDNDETAILQLSLKSNYTDYEKFIQYPYEDNQTKIRLVYGPAVYDLDLMLIKGDDMIGGYRGEWEADYYELKDKDNITFHLVRQWPTPQTEEDQIMMIDFLYNNETYLELLKPTFE